MTEPSLSLPIVKLRPGKGRRLRSGAPWVFADEIAMDRRTRKLAPGVLVNLRDGLEDLGVAAFNPDSQIKKYDPEMEYIKRWLPELNTPDYPRPIVDYPYARQRALAVYKTTLTEVNVSRIRDNPR